MHLRWSSFSYLQATTLSFSSENLSSRIHNMNEVATPVFPKLHLTDLPPRVLTRIFRSLAGPNPRCPHSFIPISQPLSLSCVHLYRIHRLAIYDPESFTLLTSNCSQSCLRILDRLISLTVHRLSPFDCEISLQLEFTDHAYALTRAGYIKPGSESKPTVLENQARVSEVQLWHILYSLSRCRYLKQLVFKEIVVCSEVLWNVLSTLPQLTKLFIEDNVCCFDEKYLPLIAGLPILKKLYIRSDAIVNLSPLKNLSQLRQLHLRGSLISNHSLRAIISSLINLEELDVTDTDVTPEIESSLPRGLITLKAGMHSMFKNGDPKEQFKKSCSCVLPQENGHMASCELSDTGLLIRQRSARLMYINSAMFPKLRELHWGQFRGHCQNGYALRGFFDLRVLRVSGPDYRDEIFDQVQGLDTLGLTGCMITDVGLPRARANILEVANCPLVSMEGMWKIRCPKVFWGELGQKRMPLKDFRRLLEDWHA